MSDIDVDGFAHLTGAAQAVAIVLREWALTAEKIAQTVCALTEAFSLRKDRGAWRRYRPTAFHYARARAEAKRRGLAHEPATVEMWAWHYRRQGMAGRVIP